MRVAVARHPWLRDPLRSNSWAEASSCPHPHAAPADSHRSRVGAGLPGNSPSAWVYGLSGLGQVRDPEEHCSFLRLTREENEPPDRPGAETSPWGAWQGRRWLVPAGGGGDSGPPGAAAGPQLLRANSCYLVPRAAHPGSSFVVGFQTWGMLSRGSARFLKFPTSPSSDCLPCPVFCPSPSGALPARCPAPTAIPPNKVSGPLGDATLPPRPPHRFPPSSATNVRVWEGGQMPPRTLEQ